MVHNLEEKDCLEVKKYFELLHCSLARQEVWGTLLIDCYFDIGKKVLGYDNARSNENIYLSDSYEVRIDFKRKDMFCFPTVYEESCKIKKFSYSAERSLGDLHINDDNSCCLGVFPEYRWTGVTNYIFDKVIPFFYWQSYLRLYNNEPWKTLSHGIQGLYESLSFSYKLVTSSQTRNTSCPCRKNKKYKYCCLSKDKLIIKAIKNMKFNSK